MNDLITLEYLISTNIRPHFLAITEEDGVISIVLSHPSFQFMEMNERVSRVFSLIRLYNSDILDNRIIVIQPFSGEELSDLLEYWV